MQKKALINLIVSKIIHRRMSLHIYPLEIIVLHHALGEFLLYRKFKIRLSAANLNGNGPTKAATANHHQIRREFLFN